MKTICITAAAILLLAQLSTCYAVGLTVTLFKANQSDQYHWSNTSCAVYYDQWGDIPSEKHPSKFFQAVVGSASDPSGCEGVEEVRGRAAVVVESNCSFYQQALVSQTAEASLLVVVSNSSNLRDLTKLDDWFSPPNESATISLPVVFVEREVGESLLAHLNSSDAVFVTAYVIPASIFDPSGVVIIVIAIVTVFVASYLANTPFQFLKYGLLYREGEGRSRSRSSSSETDGDSEQGNPGVMATLVTLAVFVVAICTLLVLLYLYYYPMVYVVIGLYCLGTFAGLYHVLSPIVALIPGFKRCRLPENRIPILEYRPDPRFFLTLIFCAGVVVWWALERHASYAWILQDILGFVFITYLLTRILFLRVWVVAILMIVLFFYDIFMVFVTPLFTKDGESVMVKAATGGGDSSEQLPIVFTVPKFLPNELDHECAKYTGSLGRSLLGYGDVGVPALLVALCLQFDLQQRAHKRLHLYYLISGLAYVVGLILTFIALVFMKRAQPALLYLVPTTLGAATFTALVRREFILFFTGKPPKSKSTERERSGSDASGSEGSLKADGNPETESETELDNDGNNSEKDALLINKEQDQ